MDSSEERALSKIALKIFTFDLSSIYVRFYIKRGNLC